MKALPNLEDEAAMLARGRRSALYEARKEALEALRDAYTLLAGADWYEMRERLAAVSSATLRLETCCTLWESIQ